MCGIFGLLLKRSLTDADITLGRRGTAALAHRGPDGSGDWYDREAGVFLGHRRLAIIDLTDTGAQPMSVGDATMTYNGEMYNYPDLKRDLTTAGTAFFGNSDTEVLMRLWQKTGDAALQCVDGMFALAHWDGSVATLAVDPFGEKPLFVVENEDGLYFSSEAAPLVELLHLQPHMEAENWGAFLALSFLPAPLSAYPGLRRLAPSTILKVRGGACVEETQGWRPGIGEGQTGPLEPLTDRTLDKISQALTESLEARLRADVPVICFLSSGVDSALMAAIASRELSRDLHCLTVAISGEADIPDESTAAKEIADHLGLPHQSLTAGDRKLTLADMLHLNCDLNANTGILPIYKVSETASRIAKVAVTGMGGDEIAWGYSKHTHYWRWRNAYQLAEHAQPVFDALSRRASGRIGRMALRMTPGRSERYFANKIFPAYHWLSRVPGFKEFASAAFSPEDTRPLEFQVPEYELTTVMPNQQLLSNDHASMAVGLELRSPFLNRKVCETVAELDPRTLLAFGQKAILRQVLKRYLPDHLIDRPKLGFRFPESLLIAERKNAPGPLPGLPQEMVDEAWQKRRDGAGWARIAVRLALAGQFFEQSGLRHAA